MFKRLLARFITIIFLFALPCLQTFAFAKKSTADLLKQYHNFNGQPNNPEQVTICNQLTGRYLFKSTDSAMMFARAALKGAKKLKLQKESIDIFVNISRIGYISGSYFQSLIYADSAMTLSLPLNYTPGLAAAINNRGLIYLAQNRYADAVPEFRKALAYNQQLKDSSNMTANYFNIGLCYDELHKSTEAFKYLNKALHIAQANKDGHMNLMSLNRLGETNYHLKNYREALTFFQSALSFPSYQDNWERTFAYSGMAQTLYATKDYQQALENGQKSYQLAKQLNTAWDIERAVNIIAKCYAAMGNYPKAYNYQLISKAYADSLLTEQTEKEINYLHLRDKNAENQQLVRENEYNRQAIKSNRITTILVTSFALVLIVILFILRRNISHKNRLNQELSESNHAIALQKAEIQAQQKELIAINQTKDRVLSVIGHDLRSPFASVLPALEMMNSGDLDEEEQKIIMHNFQQQVVMVAGLTNNLLTWANSQQSGTALRIETIELTAITEDILALYHAVYQQKQQQLVHRFNGPVAVQGDQQHIRIILQNIISNAIKFTPRGGTIEVFYTTKNDFTGVHIKDTGKGMLPEKLKLLFKSSGSAISEKGTDDELGTGLGLLLIKQFVEENNGYVEVTSEIGKGSEFMVYFKSAVV